MAWLANRNDERAQPTDVGDPLPNDSQTDGAIDAAFDGLDLEFGLALSDR